MRIRVAVYITRYHDASALHGSLKVLMNSLFKASVEGLTECIHINCQTFTDDKNTQINLMFRIEYAEISMKITSITLSENRHVLT